MTQRKTSDWVEDGPREKAEAEGLAYLAVEFGRDDPLALSAAGIAGAFVVGKVREGGELIARSLAINPGDAVAWMYRHGVRPWNGDADGAVASVSRAFDVSPHNPDPYAANMQRLIAFGQFIGGQYEESIATAKAFIASPPNAITAAASSAASAILL